MKRIIFATAALVLVLAMLGVGTLAYFTSTRTSYTNSFSTGTLDLRLADANEPDYAGDVSATWTSPVGWAPGQEVDATLWLKNVGTVNAIAVFMDWKNLQDPSSLSHKIQVVSIKDSFPWCPPPPEASCLPFGDEYVGNYIDRADLSPFDGILTLYELQYYGTNHPEKYSGWDAVARSGEVIGEPAVLPAGKTLGLQFVFKLMDDTGNEFQGKSCTIDLVLRASQAALP